MSNLSAVPDLPGLRPQMAFDKTVPLNGVAIYAHVIGLMYLLALRPWAGWSTVQETVALGRNYNIEIVLTPMATGGPPERPSILQNGYAVVSLYDLGIAIAKDNQFYAANCDIVVVSIKVGSITIQKRSLEQQSVLLKDGVSSAESLFSSTDLSTPASQEVATLPVGPGLIVDPKRPGFRIIYEYAGSKITATDLFTACLDGYVTSAQQPSTNVGAAINGRSLSNDCAINVHGVGTPSRLTWDGVIRTLTLLYMEITAKQKAFGEMTFSIFQDDRKIGEGFILKL